MKLRDYIYKDIEGKYTKKINLIEDLIKNEIENKYNICLNCDGNKDFLLTLLLTDFKYDVKDLLIKYNYNPAELLLSICSLLCINDVRDEQLYLSVFDLFFENYKLEKINNYYLLKGPKGNMTIERFVNCIEDEELIEVVNSGLCIRQCHTVTGALGQTFYNSRIVTSLMPGRFGENYFHSYFIVNDRSVVDVANNVVFSKEGFYNYFEPCEIINYPSIELDERYEMLEEHSTDAKTLQLALEKLKEKY